MDELERYFKNSKQFCVLKALDTFGDFQRPVFSLGVFQRNVHTIETLTVWAQFGHRVVARNYKRITLVAHIFVLLDDNKRLQA